MYVVIVLNNYMFPFTKMNYFSQSTKNMLIRTAIIISFPTDLDQYLAIHFTIFIIPYIVLHAVHGHMINTKSKYFTDTATTHIVNYFNRHDNDLETLC